MLVIESVDGLIRAMDGNHSGAAGSPGPVVGLVPTMGALHAGHLSLVSGARRQCGLVVMTAFVNPLQFGSTEDLADYPRDPAGDRAQAEAGGVDVLFVPSAEEMYPEPPLASVSVARLGQVLEGARRPGHFDGVATVVAKLLNLVGPCRCYLGEKDYQQLLVVRRLVADLNFPVEVVSCPVVRDADGLALSSRNRRLNASQRSAAPVLYQALMAGKLLLLEGRAQRRMTEYLIAEVVRSEPLAELEYAAVVADGTLDPAPSPLSGSIRLLGAARIGPVRLIDNLGVTLP